MKSIFEAYGEQTSVKLLEAWKPNIEAVRSVDNGYSDERALRLAIMLENTKQELNRAQRLYEATQPVDVGPFKKHAFDLLTAVMPNLIAEELVSVQPLTQKIGQIFYLKYLFGSNKNGVQAGDTMWSHSEAGPQGYNTTNYSSEVVDQEVLGASGDVQYVGNLAYVPLRPGTVSINCGNATVTDDGNGSLLVGPNVIGTLNYASGAFDFTLANAATEDPEAEYTFNLEHAPSTIPQVNLRVEERILTARPRKLRALYAFDAAYDLKMSQGVDIDQALLEAVVAEIKHEIDGEVILDLLNQAALTSTWNMVNPQGVSQRDHRMSFIDEIASASNEIFQATKRASGNFIVVGKTGADILESLGAPRFVGNGVSAPVGPHFAGTLDNKWKVYKNPYFARDEYLVGYKGDLFLDAGYVYAPYLPIFTTSLLMMDDFVGRRGFATSYGKRMLNSNLYVAGQITQIP